jgi:formylmethanofuran dehydrogenase subunit D
MGRLGLILVSGRSIKQGVGISEGKEKHEYLEATRGVDLNPEDMERSGLEEGSLVRIESEYGTVEVPCRRSDVPEGIAFMAFGSAYNRLVGGETYASGMPDSKNLKVELTPVPSNLER